MKSDGILGISGCQLYYAPDTHSPYGTIVDASGSPIVFTTLPNRGALGGTFSSAAAVRPTVNRIEYRRSAQFDGTDDAHTSSLGASAWDFLHDKGTVVLLFRANGAADGNLLTTIDDELATKIGFMAQYETAGKLRMRIGNGSGAWRLNLVSAGSPSAGTVHLVILRFDADETVEVDQRIDGAADSTDTLTGAASTAAPTSTATIGAEGGPGADYFSGDIIFAAAWDRYLTIGEVQDIESALTPVPGPVTLLPELGTMVAMYMGNWPGNTITTLVATDKIETWQNITNPGTHDLDQANDAARVTYDPVGWNGMNATGHFVSNHWYRVDSLAASFTGDDQPITIVLAAEFLSTHGYFDSTFCLNDAGTPANGVHALDFDVTGKWRSIRGVTAGVFKAASDAVPSGREIIIVTLAGGTALTSWRNGVKASNAVDLDVAAVTFTTAAVGGIPSGASVSDGISNVHLGLMGIYTTAFTDAQAAAAYTAINRVYPHS